MMRRNILINGSTPTPKRQLSAARYPIKITLINVSNWKGRRLAKKKEIFSKWRAREKKLNSNFVVLWLFFRPFLTMTIFYKFKSPASFNIAFF